MSISGTLVLNCAGIGSRLGLGKTKVLMELNGKTLLERHLENFKHVQDLRIVVGFQSADVIALAASMRKDILFVYNHDYFDTSSGYSFWLGARFGTPDVMQWDGDLIIHPDDAALCLRQQSPFIAYSKKRSQDGVFCDVNATGQVTRFSRKHGEFEWTGPCCMASTYIKPDTEYVFNMLEQALPLPGIEVRAMDIDTVEDYRTAASLLRTWEVL